MANAVGTRRYASDRPVAIALGLINPKPFLSASFGEESDLKSDLDIALLHSGAGDSEEFRRILKGVVADHIERLIDCDQQLMKIVKDGDALVHHGRVSLTFANVPLATGGEMDVQVLRSLEVLCPVCHAPADQNCSLKY